MIGSKFNISVWVDSVNGASLALEIAGVGDVQRPLFIGVNATLAGQDFGAGIVQGEFDMLTPGMTVHRDTRTRMEGRTV